MTIETLLFYRRLHLNIVKSFYVNFRCFPFTKAWRFPILVFGKVGFEGLRKGCIQTKSFRTGAVHIGGGYHTEMFGYSSINKTYLKISGVLSLGDSVTIDQGCLISICSGAKVHIGDGVYINRNVKIHSKESIYIGDNTRIGWESQVFDTNFHYTLCHGRISRINKPVIINHNVWIGNRVTVSKGAILPAFSVVAAMSLVNKDFSNNGEACLFGGVPAKYITDDIKRLLGVEPLFSRLFKDDFKDSIELEEVEEQIKNCFYQNDHNG